jgi:hypothetical protein
MIHGRLHTLPAVYSPVTLNVPSRPFSYAMGPSVVGRGLHALALCWCMCVGLRHPKAGNAVPGCHMPCVPPIIRPVRCHGTLLTPASFSFLSSLSFALSAGHSAILSNDVALWGRNGAGGRAACPPRACRTWAAYASGVRGVVVHNSAVCRCPPHLVLLWTMLLEHAGRCHLTSSLLLT